MKKRLLSVLCALTLILALFPVTAGASDMGKAGQTNTVSAGYIHTVAIEADGTLWAWGDNECGELGDGTTEDRLFPVQVMKNVAAVSAGIGYTMAIKTDGTLWAWGRNDWGQLGNGGVGNDKAREGRTIQTIPVQVMKNVASVSAGGWHTMAIKTDGTLWAWGENSTGRLGNGGVSNDKSYDDIPFQTIPVQVMKNVASVSAGVIHTMAIKTDGTLWAWGANDNGQLGNGGVSNAKDKHGTPFQTIPVQVMDNVAAVSAGGGHTMAIKTDGTLWAWGFNFAGVFGDSITEDNPFPVQVMDHVASVSAGWYHTMAIKTDGTLWAWGSSGRQLGDGTMENHDSSVQVMDNVASVNAGYEHTMAIKTDGTLWAWGDNDYGQIGNGGVGNDTVGGDEYGNPIQTIPVQVLAGVALPRGTAPVAPAPAPAPVAPQYIYDTTDPGKAVILPTEKLDTVTSADTAVSAVSAAVSGMTAEQKTSATGADWATLFAEETVSRAASKEVAGAVVLNAAAIADLQKVAETTAAAVDSALVKGGISTARYLSNTVSLVTKETGEISIQIDPSVLDTKTDKVRVETPSYAVTIQIADLADELKAGKSITITAQAVGDSETGTVKLGFPNGRISNPVTLSLPAAKGDANYQAVLAADGKTVPSKRNPATGKIDAKIATNGTYTVKMNKKDFNDISKKSAEMQDAIRYLAAKGIIGGTTETTFSPDGTISRAEIAALLMRALGKLDSTAVCTFPDVKPGDWYATAAASSAKHGIINGMSNGNFAGKKVIAKDQIVAVSARVLKTEMRYKETKNPQTYLEKYSDTVGKWAQSDVALATRENLVVQCKDGTFQGTGNMTRGDAAIIIYRLFNKIW